MLDQFRPVADGKFIEFRPSGEDFKLAAERSERMGVLANSYTNGAGRIYGMLGEIAVQKYLGDTINHCGESSKCYDLITHSGISIEVKTKKAKAIPKMEYSASVELKKTHMFQNDLFVFLRAHDSMVKLWMLGWVKTDSFKRRADFKKAGEPDGDNGFTYRVDGYHIPINKLKRIETLKSYLGCD
jgi:hypothetical protein